LENQILAKKTGKDDPGILFTLGAGEQRKPSEKSEGQKKGQTGFPEAIRIGKKQMGWGIHRDW